MMLVICFHENHRDMISQSWMISYSICTHILHTSTLCLCAQKTFVLNALVFLKVKIQKRTNQVGHCFHLLLLKNLLDYELDMGWDKRANLHFFLKDMLP